MCTGRADLPSEKKTIREIIAGGRSNGLRRCCDCHIIVHCTRKLGMFFSGSGLGVLGVAVVEGKLAPYHSPPFRAGITSWSAGPS